MNTQDLIDLGAAYLTEHCQLHTFERRSSDLHLHRDDATCSWWMIDDGDLEVLGRYLRNDTPDAYSRWCSATTAPEVETNDVVLSWDMDEDTDLDALEDEAGAADDMVSYMALAYLRDEIEEIIEQNAEIMAENEAA